MIALYLPGSSPVHRLSAGIKLGTLALVGSALFFVDRPDVLALALLATVILYALAGVAVRESLASLRPMLWMVLLLFAVHTLINGWLTGLVAGLRFMVLVSLAVLLTLTTRASDMVAVLTRLLRPFERVGLPSERLALMLSMTLRYIPMLYREYQSLVDVHRARGGRGRTLPLLMPLLVRSLRQADALAEAIDARAYDPQRRVATTHRQGQNT